MAMVLEENGLPTMLLSMRDPLEDFTKDRYEPRFRAYVEEHGAAMDAIEDAYCMAEDRQGLLDALTEGLMSEVGTCMEGKSRRKQEDLLLRFNMCLVAYLDPALLEHNKESGEPLVDTVLAAWKGRFPKTNLKAVDFAGIDAGFRRRYCYITTAVCESLGRPDDCYELNLLREYRDGYLNSLPEGDDLIRQYYDVAPTIVKRINREADPGKVYAGIWRDYLKPCIECIENHEEEACRKRYQEMVDVLAQKYFYQTGC